MCYLMAKELQPGHNPQELGGKPILDSTCAVNYHSQFDGIYMICFKGQVLQDKPNILGGYCSFMCIQYNFLFSLTFWSGLWWPLRGPAIKRELKITILRKLLKLLFSSTHDGIFALCTCAMRNGLKEPYKHKTWNWVTFKANVRSWLKINTFAVVSWW